MRKLLCIMMVVALPLWGEQGDKDLFGAKKEPKSKFPGEYVGTYYGDGKEIKYGLQIFALGEGRFRAIGYNGGLPGDGFEKGGKIESVEGKLSKTKKGSERIVFQNDDEEAIAELTKGKIIGSEDGKVIARLKRVDRKSPVIGKTSAQ